jgi:anti-sigma regulatory factor (Ser/Thr protein kinase)
MLAATQVFQPDPDAVRTVRRFVAEVLAGADLPVEPAELIASELATNAVLHARTEFRLVIDRDVDSVRIAVHDTGGGWPCRKPPAGDGPSGRGLRIVDQVAQRWGVTWTDPGKSVWAELSMPAVLAIAGN